MRNGWVGLAAILGTLGMVSCGGMKSTPIIGDIDAGNEPAEGGIPEVPNPSAAMAQKSGFSLEKIQRGHEVYMLKCGECHVYQLPQNLDIDEWQVTVPKMIKHAGLEPADEKAVLAYVVAVKKQRGD